MAANQSHRWMKCVTACPLMKDVVCCSPANAAPL
jgi:hypothetical protein